MASRRHPWNSTHCILFASRFGFLTNHVRASGFLKVSSIQNLCLVSQSLRKPTTPKNSNLYFEVLIDGRRTGQKYN
ncbi:uncharacterized protein LOC111378868 isoform X2 [Olea europaea var. sylvestris]|uniref:uncharacterized protein LOC111378868 isoform X2 n=1 Tax=Olea europaea var. sylvestris TaxID=158386 RepID=UPI000C1D598D|nr:uncharacterized protein LOC111378868 isoform X2 [Olea europaea var. sylvestris]